MLCKITALATIVGIVAMPANVATPKTDLKELDATDDVAKNADTTTETDHPVSSLQTGCGAKYWKLSSVSAHIASVEIGECAHDTFEYEHDVGYFAPNNDAAIRPFKSKRDLDYPFPSCEGNPMTKHECELWAKNTYGSFTYGSYGDYRKNNYKLPTYNMDISNKYNPPGCFVVTANNVIAGAPSIFYNSLSKSETDPKYGKCSDAKLCVCPMLHWLP